MATGKKGVKKKVSAPYTFRFHPSVTNDLQEAYDYYEEQKKGLGEEFLTEVGKGLEYLAFHAVLFQKADRNTRKYNIAKFPYGIFYLLHKEEITVTTIMHLMRNPSVWKQRKV